MTVQYPHPQSRAGVGLPEPDVRQRHANRWFFPCPTRPKTSSHPVVSPRQVRLSPRPCVFLGSDRPPHQRAFSFLPSATPRLSIGWIQLLELSLRPWGPNQGFLLLHAHESWRADRGRLPLDTFARHGNGASDKTVLSCSRLLYAFGATSRPFARAGGFSPG